MCVCVLGCLKEDMSGVSQQSRWDLSPLSSPQKVAKFCSCEVLPKAGAGRVGSEGRGQLSRRVPVPSWCLTRVGTHSEL